MKMKDIDVVIVGKLSERLMNNVESTFNAYRLWEIADKDQFYKEHGDSIQAIVTSGNPVMGASKELMDKFANLKIVASNGVGYDPIDISHAKERGIIVTNTPGVLNKCVADIGMALLLSIGRRICEADRYVKAGRWESEGRFAMGTKISGKVCGIVGLGNIGSEVAKRASAFDMNIHFYDPGKPAKAGFTQHDSLIDLAKDSDFLVLTLPGGDKTRGLINKDVFAALGDKGFLISISRGSTVNEDDLIDALTNKVIAGAAMDVYAHEPHVPDVLKKMENVVTTPHIASSTTDTFNAMADLVYDNLCAYFADKPVLTQVV